MLRKEFFIRLLKIFLSVLLLIVVVYYIGIDKIMQTFLSMNLIYLPFIFVLFAFNIFLAPISSIFLYFPIKSKNVSASEFYHLRLFTSMLGSFTPGKLGEYSLLYILKKYHNTKIIPIFFIISLDKIITLFCILLFSLVAFLFLFNYFNLAIYVVVLLLFFMISFFFSRFVIHKIRWVSVHLFRIKRLHDFFYTIGDLLKQYLKKYYMYIFANLVMTFLLQLLVAYITKETYAAFSFSIPLFSVFLVNSVIGLLSFIPLNLFGFGIKEITSIYLYTLLGVPPAVTTSSILIFILFRYVIYLLYFASREFSFGKTTL